MKREEKAEIQKLPEKYRPIGAWKIFGLSILYAIPLIGQIFMIIHALSDNNINRRCYARSYFCILAIALVISGILIGMGSLGAILEALKAK